MKRRELLKQLLQECRNKIEAHVVAGCTMLELGFTPENLESKI